jgi:hypothetical protein
VQSLQFEWMNSEGDTFAFVEVQLGFGAQGALSDPKPQMSNLEGADAFENADSQTND